MELGNAPRVHNLIQRQVCELQGITGGVRAAKEGHQVIMTPTSHCYFDYRQSLRQASLEMQMFTSPLKPIIPVQMKDTSFVVSILLSSLLHRSDEPGAWFAMLPLEMVYDYDPIPPQPESSRPPPIPENEEELDSTAQPTEQVGEPAQVDAMSDGMSEDAHSHLDHMSDAGELPANIPVGSSLLDLNEAELLRRNQLKNVARDHTRKPL